MKNKNYITESSRNICNVCLSKVKVEFCNMQPDSSLEESEKNRRRGLILSDSYLLIYGQFTMGSSKRGSVKIRELATTMV